MKSAFRRVVGAIAALFGRKTAKRTVVQLPSPREVSEAAPRTSTPTKHSRLGLPRRRRERPARRKGLAQGTFSRAVLGHLLHPLAVLGWKAGPEHVNDRRLARNALRRVRQAVA